jgi:fibronectin type 3 domain-containing protein
MYAAIAPTLWDTTPGDTVWSVFRVSGHSFDSQVFVVSLPDSGFSVDNLAPMAPTGLVASDATTQIDLVWDEPVDADFNYFAVYRSTEMIFDPSLMEPIATTTSNAYVDEDVVAGMTYYYRVTATDFGENESDPSEVSQSAVSTEATGEIPTAFELYQNYPNPFNPSTTITFDVPFDSDVRIAVYDLLGRQVRMLASGTIPAGTHRLSMRANDMSSGLYVLRMEAGEKVFQRTMMLVK